MKKSWTVILSLLLAAVFAFSACAEEGIAFDMTMQMNWEILDMLGIENIEEVSYYLEKSAELTGRTVSHCMITGSRIDIAALVDGQLLSGCYLDFSDGLEYYNEAYPDYKFRISAEDLNEIVNALQQIAETAGSFDLTPYMELLMSFAGSLTPESLECSEEIGGIVYTEKTVITLTGEQLNSLLDALQEQLIEDLAVLGIPYEKQDLSGMLPEVCTVLEVYTNEEGYTAILRKNAEGETLVFLQAAPEGTLSFAMVNPNDPEQPMQGMILIDGNGFEATVYIGGAMLDLTVTCMENGLSAVLQVLDEARTDLTVSLLCENSENSAGAVFTLGMSGTDVIQLSLAGIQDADSGTLLCGAELGLLGETFMRANGELYLDGNCYHAAEATADCTTVDLLELFYAAYYGDEDTAMLVLQMILADTQNGIAIQDERLQQISPELYESVKCLYEGNPVSIFQGI